MRNVVGLALSGGGIRSATFSLGVVQELAAKGRLRHIDFLSTVSGGGRDPDQVFADVETLLSGARQA